MARISAKSAVGHYSPTSESENSDYNSSPGQQYHRLNNRSVVRRGPLMDVDINSVDSDDNSDYSPIGALKSTAGKQLTRLEPKGYDTTNFKINLPLKNPAKQHLQGTPSPLKNSNRVDFAPTRSVVSYSKASSPSKLLGDASNLLSKNRTPPGSFYSDTPSKATNVPQQDEWVDEEEDGDHDTSNVYDESMNDHEPSSQQIYYPRQYQQQQHDNYIPRYNVFWDPDTPSTVSAWVQIIFNVLVAGSILYFFYLFVSTIRHDIDMKVEEYSSEILAEMSVCSKEYINNNCMPGKRVPALEKMCNSWEKCMNRDPAVVGRAKVGAEAFGEIVEGFTKPISWKTIIFIICFVGGTTLISNVSLMYTRRNLGGYRRQQQQERRQSPRKTPRKPKTPSPHQTPYYTPRSTRTGMPSSRRPRRRHV